MRKGAELTQDNETKNKVDLSAMAEVSDPEALKLLVDQEDGMMRAGQLPEIQASGSGSKMLFEAFDSVMAAPKKKAKKEEPDAKKAEPKTILENLG